MTRNLYFAFNNLPAPMRFAVALSPLFPVGLATGVIEGSFFPPNTEMLSYGAVYKLYQLVAIVFSSLSMFYGALLILKGKSKGTIYYLIGYCLPNSICLYLILLREYYSLFLLSAIGVYLPAVLFTGYIWFSKDLRAYFNST